jgi:hypothetical protein
VSFFILHFKLERGRLDGQYARMWQGFNPVSQDVRKNRSVRTSANDPRRLKRRATVGKDEGGPTLEALPRTNSVG